MEKNHLKLLFSLSTFAFYSSLITFPVPGLAQENLANSPVLKMPYAPNYQYLNGWSGYLGVNYLQFSNNGTTFAESSGGKNFNVNPDYHAGYNLGLGYENPASNNGINLDYMHLRASDFSNAHAPILNLFPDMLGPVTSAQSSVTYTYNSLDLTVKHKTYITNYLNLNLYGGLNYTSLQKDMKTTGDGLGNSLIIQVGTSFNGIGPTFGVNAFVNPLDPYPNFKVYGGFNPSMLYGTMSGYIHTTINDFRVSDSIPHEKIVVPALSAKLGMEYDYLYKNAKFNFNLGYQFTQYFNVTRDSSYNNTINASFQGLFFNFGLSY